MGINAQTSVPSFSPGDTLTAANTNLLANGIGVFAGTATRDAAFGGTNEKTLAEGQFAYLEDTNTTQYYDGAAWLTLGGKVAQVVSTAKTDTFTSSSTTFTDITGLSVSITPRSATSQILVLVQLNGSEDYQVSPAFVQLVRGSTNIDLGDASSSRQRASAQFDNSFGSNMATINLMFLDSPATTSATTYKLQIRVNSGTGFINRTKTDNDNNAHARGASTITVMEISA